MGEGDGRAGAGADRAAPIDAAHLAAQTFGDAALAREVLAMFVAQARRLVGEAKAGGDLGRIAHLLSGSARGIGAHRVAAAAAAVETASVRGEDDPGTAFAELEAAIDEAVAAIEAGDIGGA